MRDLPILFSGPMVREVLADRKTQTRRLVKVGDTIEERDDGTMWPYYTTWAPGDDGGPWAACPYGEPGDRLWVRETWQYAGRTEDGYPWIRYCADGSKRLCENIPGDWHDRVTDVWAKLSAPENVAIDGLAADRSWRPSIFLPRWGARIPLAVTGVRVERLQDISEADAEAEGVKATHAGSWRHDGKTVTGRPLAHSFLVLWDSINRKRAPAESNPWVWVVEFQRAKEGT